MDKKIGKKRMENGVRGAASRREHEMPEGGMNTEPTGAAMPSGQMRTARRGVDMPQGMGARPGEGGRQRVIVEMRVPKKRGATYSADLAGDFGVSDFQLDTEYAPVPIKPSAEMAGAVEAEDEEVVLVRGTIDQSRIQELERQPQVIRVWKDTPVAPFAATVAGMEGTLVEEAVPIVHPIPGFATCPFGTCDCSPGTAKGNMADVAAYLGVDQIWAAGIRGNGIIVGIVDGGITALGRPVRPGRQRGFRVSLAASRRTGGRQRRRGVTTAT